MRIWKAWTEEDDKVLKDNAATMTSYELAAILQRGQDSVKHRARKIGVSLRKYGQRCSWAKYSDDVVETARRMHRRGVGPRDISDTIGVPYWAVCDFVYFKRGLNYGYEV